MWIVGQIGGIFARGYTRVKAQKKPPFREREVVGLAGLLRLTATRARPSLVLIAACSAVLVLPKRTSRLLQIRWRIALERRIWIDEILPIGFQCLRAGHSRMPYSTIPANYACVHFSILSTIGPFAHSCPHLARHGQDRKTTPTIAILATSRMCHTAACHSRYNAHN